MTEGVVPRQYVLGAGALAVLTETAARHRIKMILPSAVLAQVWRDGARQAILFISLRNPGLTEAPRHHDEAMRIGELLRRELRHQRA